MRQKAAFLTIIFIVIFNPIALLAQRYHFKLNVPSNFSYTEIDSIYSADYLFDTKPDPSTITNKTQILDVSVKKNQSGYLFSYTPSPKMFNKNMKISTTDLKMAAVTYHLDPNGKLLNIDLPKIIEEKLKNLPTKQANFYRNLLKTRERTRYWFSIGQLVGKSASIGETWKDSVYIRQTTGDSVLYAQNITFSEGKSQKKYLIAHFTYIPNKNQYQKFYAKGNNVVSQLTMLKPTGIGDFRGQLIKGSVKFDPNTLKVLEWNFVNTIKSFQGSGNDKTKISDVSKMHVLCKY